MLYQLMSSYPLFAPIEISDPVKATLEDIRTLEPADSLSCIVALYDAWVAEFGYETTFEDPEALVFALRIDGRSEGAGVLYNTKPNMGKDGQLTVTADFLVIGPPALVEVLRKRANGAKAISTDPKHEIQSVTVALRERDA